jgi:hypothetical protein
VCPDDISGLSEEVIKKGKFDLFYNFFFLYESTGERGKKNTYISPAMESPTPAKRNAHEHSGNEEWEQESQTRAESGGSTRQRAISTAQEEEQEQEEDERERQEHEREKGDTRKQFGVLKMEAIIQRLRARNSSWGVRSIYLS